MRMFVSPIRRLAAVVLLAVLCAIQLSAADQWVEVKSPHFTVLSNAGDRGTRKLAWQLEQIRSALAALFSWPKPT